METTSAAFERETDRIDCVAEVSVLGPLQVVREGEPVDLGGAKGRLILALLISSTDHVVSTDRLIDDVWGEDPPPTARKALQMHVSNLRRSLGDGFPLRTAPGGYVVQSASLAVDAVSFQEAAQRAIAQVRTEPASASRALAAALAKWRGPAYADLTAEPAIRAEIERLTELRLQAQEHRIDADLRAGGHADVIGELEVLTAEHPYRERFRELQMLALYRSGRQTEALRAFERTRAVLAEELGLEPSPALRALHLQVLEQSSELDLADQEEGARYAFLATDLEDSTSMWQAEPELMQQAIARHDRILEDATRANSGRVFKGTGDGVYAVFASAPDAASAAIAAQRALHDEPWPTARPLSVRMGVDEGVAANRNDDFFGPVMNRVSRIMSSGHGGQVLVPDSLSVGLPVPTRSLGTADYKGVGRVEVAQLVIDGLPDEFPPLHTDRAPKSLARSGFGRSIRGYEIRERLGEGAHGLVYRAYQSSVGREVAVKVIRPELANQPGFVKRFEAEAQFVAQLEHPHIVSMYDYWRDPEGAYLAMQLLRGGSLAASLERAPWRPPAALLLLDQIGDALEYAHRHGVIHRDLKPANVLLDDDGNAYLTDFGIATDHVEAVGVPVESSVAYVSPEEIAGEQVSTAADVYGMSLLTYEILTGDRPRLGGQPGPVQQHRTDLPAALDSVLARGAHPDPSERYPRIVDFLRALRQVFGADVVTQRSRHEPGEVRNPYKGLRAFTETDAGDFFGRDELVADLVRHVASHRLTAVVGPSGSGKSSVVRAGLVPAARRGALRGAGPRAVDGSAGGDVLVTEMFPGSFPFEELEAALLRVAVERHDGLLADLVHDDRGLLRVTKQILPDDDTELLLVIDQFEELFSLTVDDKARADFLANLVTVVADERSRLRIVITVRADYFDRPLAVPEFGALLQSALVTVAMPGDDELTRAIAQPAAVAGLEFERGLIQRIVADVVDEPGALPLLQYALTELANEREGVVLTAAGYDRSGGVAGALAGRAEEIHDGLSASARMVARDVFVRLVSVDDDGHDTRRRVRRSELTALGLAEATLDIVLAEFGAFRLLSFDHDPVTRGPTVEVAHEALIREWPRYRGWIDERREDLLLERRLEAATIEWESSGRDPSFLFTGGQLAQYASWADASDVKLTEVERELLAESRDAEQRTRAATRTRRRRVLTTVSALAVAASVLAAVAVVQMRRADVNATEAANERAAALEATDLERVQRELADASTEAAEAARAAAVAAESAEREARDAAVTRRMVADSAGLRDRNPTVSMLLALEAYGRQQDPSTLGALLTSLQRDDGYLGFMPSTTVSDGGHWIGAVDDRTVVVRTRDSVDVYDLVERQLLASTPLTSFATGPFVWGATGGGRFATLTAGPLPQLALLEPGAVTPEIFEPAGVATAVGFSEVDTMVVAGGTLVRVFSGPGFSDERFIGSHGTAAIFAAMSPDGRYAATSDVNGSITLWDVEAESAVWSRTKLTPDLWIDEGGTFELGGRANEGAPIVFGLVEGASGSPAEGTTEPLVGELRFSRDGSTLYAAFAGVMAMDVATGAAKWQAPFSQLQLAELPDGGLLGGDRLIAGGVVTDRFDDIPAAARTAVTPDGSTIVALSTEGISLWSGNGDQLIAEAIDRGDHNFATMGSDPSRVASYFIANGTSDDRLSGGVSDISGATLFDDGTSKVAYTKTGDLVTTYGQSDAAGETIVIRDPVTFEPLGPPLPAQRWGAIQTSADRRFAAVGFITGQFDGFVPVVHVYDLATAELIVSLTEGFDAGEGWGIFNMEFSPDGSMLAASDIGDVVVWDTESWDVLHVFEPTDDDSFLETAFTPDGATLAVASQRNGLIVFDVVTGERRSLAAGTVAPIGFNNVNGLAITADGRRAVVAGDGANLVDVESGALIGGPFPTSSRTQGASVGSRGVSLVTSTDEHLLVWDLSSDDWPEVACLAAGRNLTLDEWEQFGWPDEPYRPTCDRWPEPS